jgi:tetratricopeptide (TPR) repeat protein
MSRSIHTTRRTRTDLERAKFADEETKASTIEKSLRKLHRKRRIKQSVKAERKLTSAPMAGTALTSISIDVIDQAPFVYHAASPDDLRAILAALPESATLGIGRIQLCLSKKQMEENAEKCSSDRDPHTGRLGSAIFPGVWTAPILGTYYGKTGLITLHAYIFDRSSLRIPSGMCELYLRYLALYTFVHEVAHHHDHVQRVRRGRWRADEYNRVEEYADLMMEKWVREVVLPYLKKTYPQAVNEFVEWVERNAGVHFPFEFLGGDPGIKGNMIRLWSGGAASAFAHWLDEFPDSPDSIEARMSFAWSLHCHEEYSYCLRVLEGVLAVDPEFTEALTCKADTLVDMERLDEAFAIAERVLDRSPDNLDAWEVRADVLERRHEWGRLMEACTQCEAALAKSAEAKKGARLIQEKIILYRAVVSCAHGELAEMEKLLSFYSSRFPKSLRASTKQRRTARLRKVIHARAGKPLPKGHL